MLPSTPLIITPETWIISDTHFYHNNIGVVQPSRKLAGADHQELERLGCPAWNRIASGWLCLGKEEQFHPANQPTEWQAVFDSRQSWSHQSIFLWDPCCDLDQATHMRWIYWSDQVDLLSSSDCPTGGWLDQPAWVDTIIHHLWKVRNLDPTISTWAWKWESTVPGGWGRF